MLTILPPVILVLFLFGGSGSAQTEGLRQSGTNSAGSGNTSGFVETLERTVGLELRENDLWKTRQKDFENESRILAAELNAYRIQLSATNNMLHMTEIPISDLEKAWGDNGAAIQELNRKIQETEEKIQSHRAPLDRVVEQIQANTTQLQELAGHSVRGGSVEGIQKNLTSVVGILEERKQRLQKILDRLTDQKTQLQDLRDAMQGLSGRLDEQIQIRNKQEMFQRKDSPLRSVSLDWIRRDAKEFGMRFRSLVSGSFWMEYFQPLWKPGPYFLILASAGFLAVLIFMVRLRKAGDRIVASWDSAGVFWRSFGYAVVRRSLVWLGVIVYLYGYMEIRDAWITMPFLRMVFDGLLLFLFTRWAQEARKSWNRVMPYPLPEAPVYMLGILISFVFWAGFLLIFGEWLIPSGNILLVFFRIGLELGLIAWVAAFIRSWNHPKARSFSWVGYALFGVPLLLELSGYGYMAVYWIISIGKTIIAGLWIGLIGCVIREWEQAGKSDDAKTGILPNGHSVRWIGFRALWVAWATSSLVVLLFCWGAKKAVLLHIIKFLHYPVPIGDIQFSILSLFYSLVAVGVTFVVTRLWRNTLKNRVFQASGLDIGLQDSIATLSSYLIWALGIFIALRVVGVSATSLTVVFGALSIGLGFGLQNIFNNFISGIILLFERPIQIGDAVEIGGIWGIVKKINFRSTLVQTYDNASLIIPNSEFISNRVTNWSFKDQRLRRIIPIGVAYGTDARLAADLLLEVARSCPWVLAEPKPDVLFSDFGDSALMFRLRFWTLLDHIVAAENDIRYRINERFAEKNIEIPFPQQDVHIRSTPAGGSNE
jgi:small-conductance mechanosensitive channel